MRAKFSKKAEQQNKYMTLHLFGLTPEQLRQTEAAIETLQGPNFCISTCDRSRQEAERFGFEYDNLKDDTRELIDNSAMFGLIQSVGHNPKSGPNYGKTGSAYMNHKIICGGRASNGDSLVHYLNFAVNASVPIIHLDKP